MSDDEAGTSTQGPKDRKREHFSFDELTALGEGIEEHRAVVLNSKSSTNYERYDAWVAVQARVNAVSSFGRDIPSLKHRRQDIKVHVRKAMDAHRKRMAATGGGSMPRLHLHPWEQLAADIMQAESVEGIGDMQFGVPRTGRQPSTPAPPRATRSRAAADGSGPQLPSAPTTQAQQPGTAAPPPPPDVRPAPEEAPQAEPVSKAKRPKRQ